MGQRACVCAASTSSRAAVLRHARASNCESKTDRHAVLIAQLRVRIASRLSALRRATKRAVAVSRPAQRASLARAPERCRSLPSRWAGPSTRDARRVQQFEAREHSQTRSTRERRRGRAQQHLTFASKNLPHEQVTLQRAASARPARRAIELSRRASARARGSSWFAGALSRRNLRIPIRAASGGARTMADAAGAGARRRARTTPRPRAAHFECRAETWMSSVS